MGRNQVEMFTSLDGPVSEDHPCRRFEAVVDLAVLSGPLVALYSDRGRPEPGAERAFRMLVLQFTEGLPDCGMERFMRENLGGKWFCAFALSERPPDHSFFGDFRQRPGTKRLMDLFNRLRDGLKEAGLIREVFAFVDAGKSVSKLSTRDDRDKAIARGLEKFNNETADQVAADPQARFGAKGRDKFRYGCKEHTGVDMQSALINRVAATPANVTDARGVRHVCADQGAVFGDKGYCTQPAQAAPKRKGCHNATIKKRNMKGKDADRDRRYAHLRMPCERVFSKRSNRVRYKGQAKVRFQVAMQAIGHNLKRLTRPGVEKVPILSA